MGLATRVIVTMLIRGDQLVKGKQFNSWRTVGSALQAVKVQNARGVDELCILDISATPEHRGPNFALIEKLTTDCFCPVTVGGGVRSVQDVRDLLNAGADKVSIGTNAVPLVLPCSQKFGSQAIVCAVDAKRGMSAWWSGQCVSNLPAVVYAKKAAEEGAGEILLTAIDKEGEMAGYDLDLIREVSAAVSVPVIAHGGCSGYQDMVDAVRSGASAVAAGALFQFSDATPREAAKYLQANNIEARIA